MFTLARSQRTPSTDLDRGDAARVLIGVGIAIATVGAAGLAGGLEPFRTYFYAFAWWGWICVASGWTQLAGQRSIALTRPLAFLLLTLWSVPFWLLFELVNVALQNWYYVGAMPTRPERLFGMAVCFATVLPGVLATREWLAALGLFGSARCRPWPIGPRAIRAAWIVGAAFTVLPLVWPERCYPLVWGATVLLGEAWLASRGRRGLWSHLAAGDPRPALQLLAAGFVTGGLWESWNFRAGAKWIYTVPGFEELKLFEMPVLGFLGFPPFALECFSFASLAVALGLVPPFDDEFERAPRPSRRRLALGAVAATIASLPMMWITDVQTVRGTRPLLEDVRALDALHVADLRALGLSDARDLLPLLEATTPPAVIAEMSSARREQLERELGLLTTAGLGARGVAWLAAVGVRDVEDLAELDWRTVIEFANSQQAAELREQWGPTPYGREVRYWIRSADPQP